MSWIEQDAQHYSYQHITSVDLPLAERIKRCIAHAERHNQMSNALWPNMPFNVTIGELLNAAARGEK
jgi:hypothetical protein